MCRTHRTVVSRTFEASNKTKHEKRVSILVFFFFFLKCKINVQNCWANDDDVSFLAGRGTLTQLPLSVMAVRQTRGRPEQGCAHQAFLFSNAFWSQLETKVRFRPMPPKLFGRGHGALLTLVGPEKLTDSFSRFTSHLVTQGWHQFTVCHKNSCSTNWYNSLLASLEASAELSLNVFGTSNVPLCKWL